MLCATYVSMAITLRKWLLLLGVEIVLFVVANAAYGKNGNKNHPFLHALSNVSWVAFLVGFVLLVVLGIIGLVQSRQRRDVSSEDRT